MGSEFVNQSPLQNTCEATDGLTLFRFTSCVDSVHKNQYTNDEFFTASQAMFLVFFPRSWACDMIPCQETTICCEIDSLDQA